jgi:hypothetical protein
LVSAARPRLARPLACKSGAIGRVYMAQPDSRGAAECGLVARTNARARPPTCIFPPLPASPETLESSVSREPCSRWQASPQGPVCRERRKLDQGLDATNQSLVGSDLGAHKQVNKPNPDASSGRPCRHDPGCSGAMHTEGNMNQSHSSLLISSLHVLRLVAAR